MLSENEYLKLAIFFTNMKYIHGNDFVNSTLKRHPEIRNALIEYEKEFILRVESNLKSED